MPTTKCHQTPNWQNAITLPTRSQDVLKTRKGEHPGSAVVAVPPLPLPTGTPSAPVPQGGPHLWVPYATETRESYAARAFAALAEAQAVLTTPTSPPPPLFAEPEEMA